MSDVALAEPIPAVADQALISAYLEGDERAFEVLVSRYQNKLVNYVNRLVHDFDLAVDLTQEAFIRVYRNADRYEGRYQFSTWLYRIATNLAIDEIRRRQRKSRVLFQSVVDWVVGEDGKCELPDTRLSPEDSANQSEELEQLQTALNSLPDKYRLAFILKEVQDLSYEEVADVLEVSQGTVKSRVHRAKLLLREKLSGIFR